MRRRIQPYLKRIINIVTGIFMVVGFVIFLLGTARSSQVQIGSYDVSKAIYPIIGFSIYLLAVYARRLALPDQPMSVHIRRINRVIIILQVAFIGLFLFMASTADEILPDGREFLSGLGIEVLGAFVTFLVFDLLLDIFQARNPFGSYYKRDQQLKELIERWNQEISEAQRLGNWRGKAPGHDMPATYYHGTAHGLAQAREDIRKILDSK